MISTPSQETTTTPLTVRRIGRFSISEKLGKGANGTVYLGHDPVIDRPVAVKLLSCSGGAAEKKQREQQFINEARAAGRLSHPNIVTIYDASSEGGTTFIAMEFLHGQDLRDIIASGKRFDSIDVASIVIQIADALAYAHEHGVIHRDIKPANIFILSNNQPKVVDFGIARAPNRILNENSAQIHTLFNNNILGTPNYMSREQALGQQVNALTDVYSLGAVMYEMLTMQKPFQSEDINKLLHQIAHKAIKSPSEINPDIPQKLSQIVMRAMQKDPQERFQSAADMANALRKFTAKHRRSKPSDSPREDKNTIQESPWYSGKSSLFWLSWIALGVALSVVLSSFIGKT